MWLPLVSPRPPGYPPDDVVETLEGLFGSKIVLEKPHAWFYVPLKRGCECLSQAKPRICLDELLLAVRPCEGHVLSIDLHSLGVECCLGQG